MEMRGEEGKQADDAVNYFIGPVAPSLGHVALIVCLRVTKLL